MLHCAKLCGRTGVRWFAAHDRLTTLRGPISVLTDTARTDLGVDNTARTDLGVDDTVRADLGLDDTVRLISV